MTLHSPLWHHAPLLLVVCLAGAGAGCSSGPSSGNPPSSPTISSVTVSCLVTTQEANLTDQCSATVTETGNFNPAVTWSASPGTVSPSGLFTAPPSAGTATVTATSVQDPSKSGSLNIAVTPAPASQSSGFQFNGITHTSYQANEYNTPAGVTSQDALAATAANWAGVLVTQYQASATSTSIAPTSSTPTDAAVIAAIQELHNKGLKVMLKPHVDALSGEWRGTFQPSDVNAWFASFTSFITHYAQLAQANSVEMLCVGTEYVQLSGSANRANWISVINAIRNAGYTGLLAYAANATSAADEFTSVSFWDQVDVIGLDAYFPLTNHNDPTVSELVSAWSGNASGINIVAAIQNFAAAHPGRPVIFTEIGYRSVSGTNTRPYDYAFTAPFDTTEQQNCYEAMYEVWSQQGASLKGAFWWSWSVPVPAANDTDYSPWTKPAEFILRLWQ
jgi:Glycoside Hydrolase Family 113